MNNFSTASQSLLLAFTEIAVYLSQFPRKNNSVSYTEYTDVTYFTDSAMMIESALVEILKIGKTYE